MVDKSAFLDAGKEIAAHPLLVRAAGGTLPIQTWRRYFSARLAAGPSFVNFLGTLKEQATQQGYPDIAAAVGMNLDEERGVVDGKVEADRAHEQWREWFRVGLQRVCERDGQPAMSFDPPDDFVEVRGYPQVFTELVDEGDVLKSMGALGILEIGLADEYDQILLGIDDAFPGLTAREMGYLRSHAHHDVRHFEQVFGPLNAACRTPAEVQRALAGLARAKRTKLAFLDGAYRGAPSA